MNLYVCMVFNGTSAHKGHQHQESVKVHCSERVKTVNEIARRIIIRWQYQEKQCMH